MMVSLHKRFRILLMLYMIITIKCQVYSAKATKRERKGERKRESVDRDFWKSLRTMPKVNVPAKRPSAPANTITNQRPQ